MMDFLRGLAPRRDGDSSWAAPVVPSRFSGVRPLSTELPASNASLAVSPDVARDSRQAEFRAASPVPAEERAAGYVAPLAARPLLPPAPHVQSPPPVHHHHHEPVAVERVVTPVVTPPSVQRIVTQAVVSTPAESAAVSRAEMPAVGIHQSRAAARNELPLQAVTIAAPLSPAAVAERKAAQTTARPVVHVTIDRIEVRAPAAARPAARSSRNRASAPSVSLTDYLRKPRNGEGAA